MPEPALDIIGERCGAFVALRWILFEALQTNGRKLGIHFRIARSRIARLAFQYHADRLVSCSTGKWRFTGEHLIKHCA